MKSGMENMSREDLYKTQIRLEGVRFNDAGYLERWKDMPGGESGPPARVVAVDYGQKQSVYFRSGIAPEAEVLVRGLPFQLLLDGDCEVFDILNGQKKVEGHAQYWTYTVSDTTAIPRCPAAQTLSSRNGLLRGFSDGFFGIDYDQVFAVIADGVVVSAAASSREDETAAELWVYTHPEHRQRGLGTQAAAAWLRRVTDRGLTPFYSHVKDNDSSRRLAESLPLRLCFVLSRYP